VTDIELTFIAGKTRIRDKVMPIIDNAAVYITFLFSLLNRSLLYLKF
jgi:hypothetical protein